MLWCLCPQCIGCLTIVDNIVVGLEGWIERKACSKVAVHLLVTFFVMCIAKGLGIIQTTKVSSGARGEQCQRTKVNSGAGGNNARQPR